MTDDAVLVCILAPAGEQLLLADNVLDACTCGARVQRRPHTPPATIMCMPCFEKLVCPSERIAVTKETLRDLAIFFGATGRPN
jgi:hypothetical protein